MCVPPKKRTFNGNFKDSDIIKNSIQVQVHVLKKNLNALIKRN